MIGLRWLHQLCRKQGHPCRTSGDLPLAGRNFVTAYLLNQDGKFQGPMGRESTVISMPSWKASGTRTASHLTASLERPRRLDDHLCIGGSTYARSGWVGRLACG